jgi:hypothetical protein
LQGDRGLAGPGISFQQVRSVTRQAPGKYIVQACNAGGRPGQLLRCDIHHGKTRSDIGQNGHLDVQFAVTGH